MGRNPVNIKFPEDKIAINQIRQSFLATMLTSSCAAGIAAYAISTKVLHRRHRAFGTIGRRATFIKARAHQINLFWQVDASLGSLLVDSSYL
jgi:hypothetical protein